MAQGSDLHARHDALLIAGLAAGDLVAAELAAATTLVRDCAECRALHDDLRFVARATATLPPAARTRAFTISAEQAARLRPTGWRGAIAAFAAPRMAFTRSLGVGLTTLGLAGLLVTTLSSTPLSQSLGAAAGASQAPISAEAYGAPAAGGDASQDVTDEGTATMRASADRLDPVDAGASQPAASGAGAMPAASPAASQAPAVAQAQPTGRDTAGEGDMERLLQGEDGAPVSEPRYLLVGSAALILFGLALLVIRRVAGRIAAL